MQEHLIRIQEYGRYKGPRLEKTCFYDILSAGKYVESNKESKRSIQQARDGHKKSSAREKFQIAGTGARVKEHHKKSKPTTAPKEASNIAKPVASGSKKTFKPIHSIFNNSSKISQEEQD